MNEKCEHDNIAIISDRDLETGDVIFKTLCKDCGKVLEIETYEHDPRL